MDMDDWGKSKPIIGISRRKSKYHSSLSAVSVSLHPVRSDSFVEENYED